MKVSVVTTYYNRRDQLRLTLETISRSCLRDEVEVICVDDGSNSAQMADKVLKSSGLLFNYIYIPPERKTWINPCIAFNIGFKEAKGEIVIIQNAECFHVGDVITHAYRNVKENYLVYSCKNVKEPETRKLWRKKSNSDLFEQHAEALRKQKYGWYNHPNFNPRKYHFTSAIARKNLVELGGFDERYGPGYCFDDNELVARIERSPFNLVMIPPEECFVVHQWHPSSLPKLGNKDSLWKRNSHLFSQVTLRETSWRAN